MERGPYTTAPGRRRRWCNHEIWAEDGLWFMEDTGVPEGDPDRVTVMTSAQVRSDFRPMVYDAVTKFDLDRTLTVEALAKARCNDMYHNMRGLLDIIEQTLSEIRDQGDQSDPNVAAKKHTEFVRSKHAGTGTSTARYYERGRQLHNIRVG
jgi:hypothetical protein